MMRSDSEDEVSCRLWMKSYSALSSICVHTACEAEAFHVGWRYYGGFAEA